MTDITKRGLLHYHDDPNGKGWQHPVAVKTIADAMDCSDRLLKANYGMDPAHAVEIALHLHGLASAAIIARDSAAWRMGLSAAKLRSLAPIRDELGRIIGVTEKRRASASAAELRAALRAVAPDHPLLQAA